MSMSMSKSMSKSKIKRESINENIKNKNEKISSRYHHFLVLGAQLMRIKCEVVHKMKLLILCDTVN